MSSSLEKIVITGMGVVSPLGCSLPAFWHALNGGHSGVRELKSTPGEAIGVKYGAECWDFTGDIEQFGPLEKNLQRAIKKSQKLMCREIEMGVAACQLALNDAGLSSANMLPDRSGITYGSDYILTRPEEYIDGVRACCDDHFNVDLKLWPKTGRPKVNPLWLLKFLPNMPASHVAIFNDLRGPSNSITVREASTALTFGEALGAIRRGAADLMVVGATGSRIEPLRLVHVAGQEPLASWRDNPAEMSRPFAADRDGIVLGEGAGAFVLESISNAKRRGSKIYAEVLAVASSTVGRASGRDHVRMATRNVLESVVGRAGSELSETFHIHAAGRGDKAADLSESLAIHDLFSTNDPPKTVAAKSYFGNLGAGSASIEIIASCLALQEGKLFQTLNLNKQDPACQIVVGKNGDPAGNAFIHLACSPQGQAAGIALRRWDN